MTWLKSKWNHMTNSKFRIQKESSNSVHPVQSYEIIKIGIENLPFLKSVKKYITLPSFGFMVSNGVKRA